MSARLCDDCGGRRTPDCPHDPFERPPLTVDDLMKPSPLEKRIWELLGWTMGSTRLTDALAAERAGQQRLW